MPSGHEILQKLCDCIVDFEMDEIQQVADEAIKAGIEPYVVIIEGLSKGMAIVSKRYSAGEFFLSDLIMAGETMKAAMEVIEPHLKASIAAGTSGVVVIGTVQGDLHNIGKDLVVTLLRSAGFQVIDLGIDVPPEKFVDAIREEKPDITAMSSLLTTTKPNMKETIQKLKEECLREDIKILVGGAPISNEFAQEIGADAYGKDAIEGVRICQKWMESKSANK
jgi:5-methyltetrahydrofolate--homocysteine methyltransferase